MNRLHLPSLLTISLMLFAATSVRADVFENRFASVMLGGKKIGHVHYTTRHDNQGTLQELKTRSSLSIFGKEV